MPMALQEALMPLRTPWLERILIMAIILLMVLMVPMVLMAPMALTAAGDPW